MSTPLTRKGSHVENKASHGRKWRFFFFQVFLILVSFITVCSESQISVFKQCQSNTQMSGFFLGGEGACAEAKIWTVKKKLHKALRSVQFLASFISFYFEIQCTILSCMW